MGILGQKNLGNSRIPRIEFRIPRIEFRIHKVLLVSLRYKQFSLFALSFGLLMLDSSYVVLLAKSCLSYSLILSMFIKNDKICRFTLLYFHSQTKLTRSKK